MNNIANITEVKQDVFEKTLQNHPQWLQELKRNAWETYNNLSEDPGRKEKFKDVIDSLELEFKTLDNAFTKPESRASTDLWGGLSGDFILNSEFHLDEELKNKGVILKSLKTALQENEELLKPYLNKSLLTTRDSRFTALAEALWEDGTFLYVPKDVEVSLPIHLLKYLNKGGIHNYYKTLVVVERGSKLLIVDEYTSENTEDFFMVSGINEIHVKDSADVTYLHLQNFDYNAFNFSLQKAMVAKDANLKVLSLSLGSQFSYENIRTYMEGQGANSQILGLVLGHEEQVFQHETLQYHPVPNASSDLHFEVMLDDEAESAHNGYVQIEKVAQLSRAHQLVRNLLLSRKAKAEAIPNLEILADDVKCSHGVSLGPVNDQELFYLMSRGCDRTKAENFIMEGNVERVLNKIENEELAEKIRDYVLENLSRKGVN